MPIESTIYLTQHENQTEPVKRLAPVTPAKALEILNKVNFFDVFNKEEKDVLTGFYSHFHVALKGDRIIAQGAKDQSFYIILSGRVSVQHRGSNQPLAFLEAGDIFGEMSFLTDCMRTTSIFAEVTTIIFEVNRATLNNLDLPVREKLKDNIISVLASRITRMNEAVIELSKEV